jgi:transposase
MSHAGRIIGIHGLEIERVVRRKGIEVWAKPVHRPFCKHCQSDGLRIKATHLRTVKHTRLGDQVMTLHMRVPKYHCQECKRLSVIRLRVFGRVTAPLRRIDWKSSMHMMAATSISITTSQRMPFGPLL